MNKNISKYRDFKNKLNEGREDEDYSQEEEDVNDEFLNIEEVGDEDVEMESEDPYKEDMEFLCSTIRSLFKNSDVDIDVDYDGFDISLYAFPEKREKMSSLLKIFDVVHKLKKDILPQYESEFELYESKKGDPVFSFQFIFSTGEPGEEEESGDTEDGSPDDGPFTTNVASLF